MKTSFLRVSSMLLIAGVVTMMVASCGSSKSVATKPNATKITIPCSGPNYQSNSKSLRFAGIGESMDLMTAKKKAMSEARAGLAAAINTTVKSVTDNYVKSGNYNNKEELMKNYEGVQREVVNQSLAGTSVICEESFQTNQGSFQYYVCLELGGSEVLQTLNNKMTSNEQLKVDYNYEKFKKTFDEEMSKQGN
ncbi:MAG: hypothetical protein ACOYMD_02745 [Paludibacter sp.]|jgi:outer membrane protein assembly factor BamE (lipoprotein component of BamABCDE complex)